MKPRLAVIAGQAVLFLASCGRWDPTPAELTTALASRIAIETPEFYSGYSLIDIGPATPGTRSYKGFATAPIRLKQRESFKVLSGNAEFRYWDGLWHLHEFDFSENGVVKTVHVAVPSSPGVPDDVIKTKRNLPEGKP